uniref:Uncharacterized protein n=1 Tax=Arundo donax TaxID=35708 RepID=A0A0A8ZX37_ARUDO
MAPTFWALRWTRRRKSGRRRPEVVKWVRHPEGAAMLQ